MTRNGALAIGAALTIAMTTTVASPMGGNRAIATTIETYARQQLGHDEMDHVIVNIESHPFRRRLFLAGPADDFQRAEIVRRMEELPGVDEARWNHRQPLFPLPMMVEAILMTLAAYAAGAILSYLVALRRRARALDRY